MKSTLTLLAALCCGQTLAAPLDPQAVANMVAQSEAVMSAGLCQVANDTADYGAQTVTVLLPPPVGIRRIAKNTYNRMRNLGYAKAPSGRYAMSQWIADYCGADALGGECLAARSFWSQSSLQVRAPGPGVPVLPAR